MEVVMMKKSNVMSWIAAALSLTMAGCADEAVDIGDDTPPAVLGASLSDYEGTWVGYAELAEWSDGTQTVRLQLDENGDGVLEFGEADPLPAPVADEGFPPGQPSHPMLGSTPVSGVISGFSYPVSGAIVQSNRIRMGSSSHELYREWCELQTSELVPGSTDAYACLGGAGFMWDGEMCFLHGEGESETPIDCGLLACAHVCQCQEEGCSVNTDSDDIRMDAALESEGSELEGSFEVPQGRYFVRMTRED
jgi:hypothetical protein